MIGNADEMKTKRTRMSHLPRSAGRAAAGSADGDAQTMKPSVWIEEQRLPLVTK